MHYHVNELVQRGSIVDDIIRCCLECAGRHALTLEDVLDSFRRADSAHPLHSLRVQVFFPLFLPLPTCAAYVTCVWHAASHADLVSSAREAPTGADLEAGSTEYHQNTRTRSQRDVGVRRMHRAVASGASVHPQRANFKLINLRFYSNSIPINLFANLANFWANLELIWGKKLVFVLCSI